VVEEMEINHQQDILVVPILVVAVVQVDIYKMEEQVAQES
jgi:hypothetical protein